jgi:HlyD family secretion protein
VAVVLLASFMSHGNVIPVQTASLQHSDIRSVISTNGKVEPVQNFQAHAPAGTTVERVLVKEGAHVKKGELLMQLDDATARSQAAAALAQMRTAEASISSVHSGGTHEEVLTVQAELKKARADSETAQRNLEALKKLQEQGAAARGEVQAARDRLSQLQADLSLLEQKQKGRYSPSEITQVEAQKKGAEASYAAVQDVLRRLNIRAPFDGTVYALPVRAGDFVNPGDLLLQEADLGQVLVRTFVDEPDIGRLALGQPIELTWDAIPGRTWKGTVANIPTSIKLRGTRNVGETTCVVDNHDLKLLPNVDVSVSIITAEHRDVLTAPREAVHLDDSRPYIYEVVNDHLKRQDIQTSISSLTRVQVTGGISENAVVALSSANGKPLRDGAPVKVVP